MGIGGCTCLHSSCIASKGKPPDVAPAALSLSHYRDGYRRREPDLSASAAVTAVVALLHGLSRSLVFGFLVVAVVVVFASGGDHAENRRYGRIADMKKDDVKAVLGRVLTWPADEQEKVVSIPAIPISRSRRSRSLIPIDPISVARCA
jgi:hypothetical protein